MTELQFTQRNSEEIRAGAVTVSFRNWRRPGAKVGGIYRLRGTGAVEVTGICAVRLAEVGAEDARRAGFADVAALTGYLALAPDSVVTRVDFRLAAAEKLPRRPALSPQAIRVKLAKMDQRCAVPWTQRVLALIGENPATRAADLAPTMGWQTQVFKANVRKLKALGLTQSLETGYRLTDLGTGIVGTRVAEGGDG